MATFKAVVRKPRKPRKDGLRCVYIRVIQNGNPGYIKTDKVIDPNLVSKSGDLKDPVVNEYCSRIILEYTERLNRRETSRMTVSEIIEFLKSEDYEICFSDYAIKHIAKIIMAGQLRNAKNYKAAVASLEQFIGSNQLMFSRLTSTNLNRWINSLSQTKRAKEMYPICIRQIYKAALLEFNDDERNVKRIKFNPWPRVKIPKADKSEKKAISAEECREFFNAPIPESKMAQPREELGRDVAQLILCLGGMNTADIFNLKKADYHHGVLHYHRAKTRNSRSDGAYMEMRVEPFVLPLFEKYRAPEDDEFLFNFHQRFSTQDSFSSNVNGGIRKMCEALGIKKENYYCGYTFRHTWATIAQNDCDANIFEVAFGLNHSHGFKVTRGYVKIDYTPAWELNAKVIDFIFFSDKPSKQGKAMDLEDSRTPFFRISPKKMVYARAYFKGKVVADFTDIGFGTIDAVIQALVTKLPTDIPKGCQVQFRIVDCDSQKETVKVHTKGSGVF